MKIPLWIINQAVSVANNHTTGYDRISDMHSQIERCEHEIIKATAERQQLLIDIEAATKEKNEAIEFLQELNK